MRRSLICVVNLALAWSCASLPPATGTSEGGSAPQAGEAQLSVEALGLVAEAQTRLATGEVADGLKLLRRATELAPTSAEVKEEFGLALANASMFDEAVSVLRKAPELSANGEATLGILLSQAAQTPADVEEAVPHLKKGIGDASQGSHARFVLGQSLVRLGRGAEGWEQVQTLLEDHPDDPRIWLLAGQVLRELGKYDQAAEYLREAAGVPDLHQRATLELVETLAAAGKFKDAAQLFGDFLSKEGATEAGLTRWATLLARAGERSKAREVLDKVLAGEPEQREALLLKAILEAGDGHVALAEQLYRKVLAAHPDDQNATLGLARLLLDVRRLEEARKLLDAAWTRLDVAARKDDDSITEVVQERAALELLDHKPQDALVWLKRCPGQVVARRTLALWGEYFRLREAFDEGVKFVAGANVGDDAEAVRVRTALLAEFRLASNDAKGAQEPLDKLFAGDVDDVTAALAVLDRRRLFAEAVSRARAAIARLGDDPALRFGLAAALERSGAWDASVKEFRALLAKTPDNAAALNYLGYMFADRGANLPEAQQLVAKAVELDPTSGAFQDSLGWVYFRLGQLDRAEKYLVEALRLEPFDATVNEHVGDLLRARGERAKAAEAYRQALTNKPEEEGQKARIEKKLTEVTSAAAP
ncbi:MAG: tetratricopeptide repeat protein [Thermoanaerobaculales bacterium]